MLGFGISRKMKPLQNSLSKKNGGPKCHVRHTDPRPYYSKFGNSGTGFSSCETRTYTFSYKMDFFFLFYSKKFVNFSLCRQHPHYKISLISLFVVNIHTVFENHRKSLIQHCERSELRLHFEWTKVSLKCQKWSILASF